MDAKPGGFDIRQRTGDDIRFQALAAVRTGKPGCIVLFATARTHDDLVRWSQHRRILVIGRTTRIGFGSALVHPLSVLGFPVVDALDQRLAILTTQLVN